MQDNILFDYIINEQNRYMDMNNNNNNNNNNETKWKKQNKINNDKNNDKNNGKTNDKTNDKKKQKSNNFDNTTKSILSKPLKNIYQIDDTIENTSQNNTLIDLENESRNKMFESFSNSPDFADKKLANELDSSNKKLQTKNKTLAGDEHCAGSSNETTQEAFGYLNYFISTLNYPSIYAYYIKEKICIYTCDILSKDKATENDKKLVIKNLDLIITLIISILVLYNLFFLFTYETLFTGINTNPLFSISDLIEKILKSNSVVNFLFQYVTYPISLLDNCFIKTIPTLIYYLQNWLPINVIWVLLFGIVFYIINYYGNYITDLFYDSLEMIYDNKKKPSDFRKGTSTIYPILQGLILLAAIYGAKQYSGSLFAGALVIIGIAIILIVQLAISQYLVTVAAIAVSMYLFIYSFFSISLYSSKGFFDTIKLIDTTIKLSSSNEKKDSEDWFIIKIIKLLTQIFYKYIFYIAAIFILIYSINDYRNNISDESLKNYLTMLISSIIIMIFSGLLIQNLDKIKTLFGFHDNEITTTANPINSPPTTAVSPSTTSVNPSNTTGGQSDLLNQPPIEKKPLSSIEGGSYSHSHPLQSDEEFHFQLNQLNELLEKQIRNKNIKNLFDKKNN